MEWKQNLVGVGWLARLAEMATSGFSERLCLNIQDEEGLRRTPKVNFRSPQACVQMITYMNIYTQHECLHACAHTTTTQAKYFLTNDLEI